MGVWEVRILGYVVELKIIMKTVVLGGFCLDSVS